MNLRDLFFGIHHSKRIQLSRAVLASLTASLVDFTLVILLMELASTSIMIAGSAGMIAGLIFVYLIGRVWIFPPVQPRFVALEAVLFILISLTGAGLHTLVLHLGSGPLGNLHYLVLKMFALVTMFSWNFSLRRVVNTLLRPTTAE